MYSAREMLARLIKCEAAGEGDSGMKAVATVVMNRVHVPSGQYQRVNQGDLRKVITQPGEFTCLMSKTGGVINPQTIWSSPPEEIHYQIADWALSGNKHSGVSNGLWYMNPYRPVCQTYFPINRSGIIFNKINLHCFYVPTPLYYRT
jgi:N-acetylmuramoyl-L-alanine amidase